MDANAKVAVVTGANKGIGLSIVKGLCQRFDGVVYLTSRDVTRGKLAVSELNKLGLFPEYHQLDITDKESIMLFRYHLRHKHGGIDILINNAAVANRAFGSTFEEDENIINVNYKSALIVQEVLHPLVRNNGRILNMSSICGHLSNLRNKYWIDRLVKSDLKIEDINEFVDWYLEASKTGTFNKEDVADNGRYAAYKISKIALSALTRIQQKELVAKDICVNSLYPGLVRTDMTMKIGFLSPDESAETPIYLVLEAPQTLKGAYVWYNREILDWADYTSDAYFKRSLAITWFPYSMLSLLRNFLYKSLAVFLE